MENKEKFLIIDGNSIMNRAFYAIRLLTTKDGLYTNALYGFLNIYYMMLEKINPDYVAPSLTGKFVAGVLSVLLAAFMYGRLYKGEQTENTEEAEKVLK